MRDCRDCLNIIMSRRIDVQIDVCQAINIDRQMVVWIDRYMVVRPDGRIDGKIARRISKSAIWPGSSTGEPHEDNCYR